LYEELYEIWQFGQIPAISPDANRCKPCRNVRIWGSVPTRASNIYIALAVSGLRQNDQALDWLEKAYQDRSNGLILLKVDPELDSLRSIPGFNPCSVALPVRIKRLGFHPV
jgi:hypothetical protein